MFLAKQMFRTYEGLFKKDFKRILEENLEEVNMDYTQYIKELEQETNYSKKRIENEIEKGVKVNILNATAKILNKDKSIFLPGYSNFLRDYIKENLIDKKELAKLMEITPQSLLYYESGIQVPNIREFYILEKITGIPVKEIVEYSGVSSELKTNFKMKIFMKNFYNLSKSERKEIKILINAVK